MNQKTIFLRCTILTAYNGEPNKADEVGGATYLSFTQSPSPTSGVTFAWSSMNPLLVICLPEIPSQKLLFVGLAPEASFNKAQADMLGDVIGDLEDNLTAVAMETDPDKKVSQWWKSLLFFS